MSDEKVKLLSGGNPQIPKADGDAPVQAYIAAMPGWKSALGGRIDKLVETNVPDVKKIVRWNQPFYSTADDPDAENSFLTFRCFTQYVKLTFARGASLDPVPPEESKHPEMRHFNIREDDELDEKLLTTWITQASKLPPPKG